MDINKTIEDNNLGRRMISFIRDDILYYAAVALAGWTIGWYIVYFISGFHLKSIGINNGILFNGISYTDKRMSMRLRTLRFRLWGNTRKLMLDDLEVKLNSRDGEEKKRNHKKRDDPLDGEIDLSIFPSNWVSRGVMRFVMRHIPTIDVGLKHTTVIYPDSTSTTIEYLRIMLVSRRSKKAIGDMKYYNTLVMNEIMNSSASDSSKAVPPMSLHTLKLKLNFLIGTERGNIHNIQIRLFTDEFKCFIFRNAKLFIDRIKRDIESIDFDSEQETESTPELNGIEEEFKMQNDAGPSKHQSRLETFFRIRNKLYPVIKEISLSLENSELLEIPFASIDDDISFQDNVTNSFRKHSLDLRSKSISFNYLKLDKNSTGFHVLFDSEIDSPFQINTSIQLLRINYCTLDKENDQTICQKDEILNIPNFNYTYKSNIVDCMVRGEGFEDCVTEFAASACSPLIDLNTAQLSTFIYNCVVLKKYFALKQLKNKNKDSTRKANEDSHGNDRGHAFNESSKECEEIDETQVESDGDNDLKNSTHTKFKYRLLKLLQDFFPKVDTKFVIEQPRFIIRHHDDNNKSNVQILDFSYSLLNLHNFTTPERDFNINCHIIHPCVNFLQKSRGKSRKYRNELIKEEILSFRSINFKLDILKSLKIKSIMAINEPVVNLSQLDIITGINDLLQDITCVAQEDLSSGLVNLKLNAAIIKLRSINPKIESTGRQISFEQKIFRHLPEWFLELDITISRLKLILGSRSVLMDKDYLDEINGQGYNTDSVPENHKLRTMRFSVDNLNVNIKNNIYESEYFLRRNSGSTETLTLNEDTETYWSINAHISQVQVALQVILDKSERRYEELLNLPMTDIYFSAINFENRNNLKCSVQINDVVGCYSRYKLSILIGAIYLVREAILTPIKLIKNKVRSDMKIFNTSVSNAATHTTSIKDLVVMDCKVSKLNFVMYLDDNYKIKLQLFEMNGNYENGIFAFNNKFLRVLVDSPFVTGYWCRIACVDDFNITLNGPFSKPEISIGSDSIRLIQPHGFVVYELFDNLSITIKILKYLLGCLKKGTKNQKIIEPKESKALKLPEIHIKSKKLSFNMEDDPFECELNMIYQLGIVEQRKRLEQLSLFETRASEERGKQSEDYGLENSDLDDKMYQLRKSISTSWIRKVKVYKGKLKEEIMQNKKYLFGNESLSPANKNEKILGYMNQAPLFSVIMSGMDLYLSTTKFDLAELPQFIHDFGQGVPIDTRYSLMIPTFLKFRVSELRMHLRDYPLPLLHVPCNKDKTSSLLMEGHLIIAEALVKEIEHLRNLHFPLVPNVKDVVNDSHYALTINKSLSTVKLYTDLEIEFASKNASRFVWGQSYQFGIQQVMLNFDQFSKPPVDPSLKLGFWDKLRLIIHGKFRINAGSNNNLEAAFKGSRDPYDLFNESSGFVLAFNDNVSWTVNENDDSRLFLNVKSDKVLWYIPNYLATPLISWTRDSSKYTFLPNSRSFFSSCFAYYLDNTRVGDLNTKVSSSRVFEKKVVSLKGGVNFIVGFLLQRDTDSGVTSQEVKHHYDIKLFNPDYTREGHDSYNGFRSDYINMSISLHANTEDSYNSIHLSPGTFKQFFSWWKLFAGNMMIPVRRGGLFGDPKKSVKFSQHLFTNKFQFNFKSLFLSHIYRDDNVDANEDKIECVGIRAKMDEFLVDLHQVKEPRIMVHEGLSTNKKIMKMNFRIGEVHLTGIDLRTVHAFFDQNAYSHKEHGDVGKSKFAVFDNDEQWFDIEDYEEAFMLSLKKSRRSVKMHPLMFSKRFSYLRDTTNTSTEVMNLEEEESTHDCFIGSKNIYALQIDLLEDRIRQLEERIKINKSKNISNEQLFKRIEFLNNDIDEQKLRQHTQKNEKNASSNSNFHNKFVLVCMFLKWNVQNRNLLYKYVHFVQLKVRLRKYLSYESIRALHDIIDQNSAEFGEDISMISKALSKMQHEKLTSEIPRKSESSQQRLKTFDNIISETNENECISEDFLIEILYPQIQLQSNETPDTIVLVAAPSIDAKIVSVLSKSNDQLVINERELEKRYGAVLNDANIFVLNQEDVLNVNKLILNKTTYGSTKNWPPWLGIEICKNGRIAGEEKLIVEKTSMLITVEEIYPQGSQLINDTNELSPESTSKEIETVSRKINVDIPEFRIISTAKQYHTLYLIVLSLLFYVEPNSKTLSEKLEKLKLSIDFLDLVALEERLVNLHTYYRLINTLANNYGFRQGMLDNEELNKYLILNVERGNTVTEIYLLMNSLLTGELFNDDSNSNSLAEWNINADSIQLCMLEDDRTQILELLMNNGKYRRRINENGSNDNRIEIENMQAKNLLQNACYANIMQPLDELYVDDSRNEFKNLITVDWCMKRSVGGIKVLDYFLINSQPLNIKIDEITGEKLLNYIFPSGSNNDVMSLFSNNSHSDTDELNQVSKDSQQDDVKPEEFLDAIEASNKTVKFDKSHADTDFRGSTRNRMKFDRSMTRLSNTRLQISSFASSNDEADEDLDQMVERSNKYLSIGNFNISPICLLISVKCHNGYKKILNVQDLFIKLPEFIIGNEILSFLEVTMKIKKMIKKALLSHIGRVLRNKLTVKKNKYKQTANLEHQKIDENIVDEVLMKI